MASLANSTAGVDQELSPIDPLSLCIFTIITPLLWALAILVVSTSKALYPPEDLVWLSPVEIRSLSRQWLRTLGLHLIPVVALLCCLLGLTFSGYAPYFCGTCSVHVALFLFLQGLGICQRPTSPLAVREFLVQKANLRHCPDRDLTKQWQALASQCRLPVNLLQRWIVHQAMNSTSPVETANLPLWLSILKALDSRPSRLDTLRHSITTPLDTVQAEEPVEMKDFVQYAPPAAEPSHKTPLPPSCSYRSHPAG